MQINLPEEQDKELLRKLIHALPISFEYLTRTNIRELYHIFFKLGWICESDMDVFNIIKAMAEEKILEAEVDKQGRVTKIRGIMNA
jgi:hypothetical protein